MQERPKKRAIRSAAFAIVVLTCFTVASGIVTRTSRAPASSGRSQAVAAAMATYPAELGAWRQIAALQLDQVTIQELQCQAYLHRVFENQRTGRSAHVLVLLGPTGTISLHTPEVCYSSREFEILGASQRVRVTDDGGTAHEFWLARVRRRDASEQVLRVYYGWGADRVWKAPSNPRFEYTFAPDLFKSQIVFPETEVSGGVDEERDFLREFLSTSAGRFFLDPS